MKLSELIFAVSIFLISCAVFSASLINVRRGVNKAEGFSKNAVALLDTDALIRKEIKNINIPYWKNFNKKFEKEKITFEEKLKIYSETKGFEVANISSIYDRKHYCEGIKVEWQLNGRKYETLEFIKQRIVNGE